MGADVAGQHLLRSARRTEVILTGRRPQYELLRLRHYHSSCKTVTLRPQEALRQDTICCHLRRRPDKHRTIALNLHSLLVLQCQGAHRVATKASMPELLSSGPTMSSRELLITNSSTIPIMSVSTRSRLGDIAFLTLLAVPAQFPLVGTPKPIVLEVARGVLGLATALQVAWRATALCPRQAVVLRAQVALDSQVALPTIDMLSSRHTSLVVRRPLEDGRLLAAWQPFLGVEVQTLEPPAGVPWAFVRRLRIHLLLTVVREDNTVVQPPSLLACKRHTPRHQAVIVMVPATQVVLVTLLHPNMLRHQLTALTLMEPLVVVYLDLGGPLTTAWVSVDSLIAILQILMLAAPIRTAVM